MNLRHELELLSTAVVVGDDLRHKHSRFFRSCYQNLNLKTRLQTKTVLYHAPVANL